MHSEHRDWVSNISLLPPLWRQIVLCGGQARLELAALLCWRSQGIRDAEGQRLELSWLSASVSFYFGIDDPLTVLFICKPQSKLSLPGAGRGEQEMAFLLGADNPVQLRLTLWPHSYSFINQELTDTIYTFFPMLLWLGGKKTSFWWWCLFKKYHIFCFKLFELPRPTNLPCPLLKLTAAEFTMGLSIKCKASRDTPCLISPKLQKTHFHFWFRLDLNRWPVWMGRTFPVASIAHFTVILILLPLMYSYC